MGSPNLDGSSRKEYDARVEADQALHVEPDAHRIFQAREKLGLADAKTNVRNKCVKVLGEMEKALQG